MTKTILPPIFVFTLIFSGCGGSREDLVTVTGKITIEGRPLREGAISFHPNDKSGRIFYGIIESGTYTMYHQRRNEIPVGRYKVVVASFIAPGDPPEKPAAKGTNSRIDLRYNALPTTPIIIEAKKEPSPGAYDISLFRKIPGDLSRK
jgi:hypothetical protein